MITHEEIQDIIRDNGGMLEEFCDGLGTSTSFAVASEILALVEKENALVKLGCLESGADQLKLILGELK